MKCPKCKSQDVDVVMNTTGKIKNRSPLQKMGRGLMNLSTLGVYGAVVPKTVGSTKSKAVAVCQNCGHTFNP